MFNSRSDASTAMNSGRLNGTDLIRQIADETLLMARFAARRGLKVPEGTLAGALAVDALLAKIAAKGESEHAAFAATDDFARELRELTRAHQRLTEVVAPATPGSIRETEGVTGLLSAIPNVGVVRKMLILGGFSLLAYVVMLCVADWSSDARVKVVLFQLQLLAAASVGAAFHSLFTANEYVTNGTFDTKYAMSYYIRFFLGLIAGPILANTLITANGGGSAADTGLSLQKLGPTAISLLGGYSADAVNRILQRLVDMMTTLVKGDAKDAIKAREVELKAKYGKLQLDQKKELSSCLMELRAGVADPEAVKKIDVLVGELIQKDDE